MTIPMRLKRNTTPVKNNSSTNTPSITYINTNTKVSADIECKEDLRIAGTIEGKVDCQQKVIINESGIVNGTITTPVADISGHINGDIKTTDKLVIRPKAVIKGDIYAKRISIEEGAQISGSLSIGDDAFTKTSSNGKETKGSESDKDKSSGNGSGSSSSKLSKAFRSKSTQES